MKKKGWMNNRIMVRRKGEPLQPNGLICEKFIKDTKRVSGLYYFEALYQGNPTAKGAGYFDEQFFRYYKELPMKSVYKVISADCAEEEKARSDYSTFQCWIETKTGYYLIDMITGKWKFPQLEQNAKMFYGKHKCNRFIIEPKSNGVALFQSLKHDTKIPVEKVDSKFMQLKKQERVNQIIGHVESGNVYFPETAGWLWDFQKQLLDFDKGEHDDQVDALVHALYYMIFRKKIIRIRSVG